MQYTIDSEELQQAIETFFTTQEQPQDEYYQHKHSNQILWSGLQFDPKVLAHFIKSYIIDNNNFVEEYRNIANLYDYIVRWYNHEKYASDEDIKAIHDTIERLVYNKSGLNIEYFCSKELIQAGKDYLNGIKIPRPKSTEAVTKKDTTGYVYVIQNAGYTKIGKTKDLKSRIRNYFKTENPTEYVLITTAKVSDYSETEKRLHEKYKKFLHRTEWFTLTESHHEEIKKYLNKISQ